jgi:hypothetical protein
MLSEHGYVKIRVGKTHPLSDPNGYAYEHDLVAIAALGRMLLSDEVVHHINEQRSDNRWENLEVLSRGDHAREHIADRERDAQGRLSSTGGPRPGTGEELDGRLWREFPKVQVAA